MTEIKWQEPPRSKMAGRNGSDEWRAIAAALLDHPGQWALVRECTSHVTAYQIKTGRIRAFKGAGPFEAVCRKRADGKFDIYARYVGGEVSA